LWSPIRNKAPELGPMASSRTECPVKHAKQGRLCPVCRSVVPRQLVVEDAEDIKSGFSITLVFRDNPFMASRALRRELHFSDEAELTIQTSEAQWREWEQVRQPRALVGIWPDRQTAGSRCGSPR
jgi:hypothetical protein